MKNTFEQKVYYSDTDSYGVVWHGSYLRWLEMGRVNWCEDLGFNLVDLENQDIVMPVTNLNVKYKLGAKLNDILTIETELVEFNGLSAQFHQVIKRDDKVCIDAQITVVAINQAGKLYRRMPEILSKKFNEVLKCPVLV